MSVIPMLEDSSGRVMRKLRVVLQDMCNFRCFYCMPEKPSFLPQSELLTPEEIEYFCSGMVNLGVTQLRITGGEPTLRKGFEDILTRLSRLKLSKLCMTTNGLFLERHLDFLWEAGCHHINISMDSLVKDKFNQITRSRGFDKVHRAILKAKEKGFVVKLNMLLLKGLNDDEVGDFVAFSAVNDIEVRFLELIKIGRGYQQHDKYFLPAAEVMEKIKAVETLTPQTMEIDSTSFNFTTPSGARIGFIASETRPFCGNCSRLRLSPVGVLYPCLMAEEGINLRGVPKEEYEVLLKELIERKPLGRRSHLERDMYQVGG